MVAVGNAWGVGQAIPIPQLRPPLFYCCSDFLSKKSKANLNFVLGWGCCSLQARNGVSSNKSRKKPGPRCLCSNNSNRNSSLEWDWNRWNRHFSEIEQAESFASVLKVPPLSPLCDSVSVRLLETHGLIFYFFLHFCGLIIMFSKRVLIWCAHSANLRIMPCLRLNSKLM